MYAKRKMAAYYREITLLDQQLGRLRKKLRDLEIADNTLLWYCSDNGGLNKQTSGGRAKKGYVYEGGLRVPGVLEWPARGLQGRTNVPVNACDIYPTLLSIAGAKRPDRSPLRRNRHHARCSTARCSAERSPWGSGTCSRGASRRGVIAY